MIEYEDFSLKIEPKRGESYPVIVLDSPAGQGRSSFQLPLDPDEIGDLLFDMGQTVRSTSQSPLRDASPAATRTPPQQIGDQLFDALFSGPVRSLFDRSLGMIHGRQRGLRIKLHIDPEDPSLAQLASLPWEFLYRKETRDFLNLSRFTPIIRYLDVQRPHTPLPLEPPLRVLVVISAPSDYARLDLGRERALIEASWATQEGVRVEFMERATILELHDRLGEQPCHVLHYMGHGDFDARTGHGALVYEDEYGNGVMVDGSTLGVLLRDVPTTRLVFLNACETAKVTRDKGLDPFAGVAAAIVMAGIPAVVAMQFPISDSAAITFAQRFYPLLARGYPVDTAVTEGRRAICLARTGTMEWGTPILFMRAPQGAIFRVPESQRVELPVPGTPEPQPEVDEALEQRLERLYTDGLSAFWLEDWERACRSFQAIVDLRPDYQDAAAKLEKAQRQANLATLYHQAQAAQEAEDWGGARSAFEELVAEAPDFKDAADMLEAVRKQKRTADLYAEARQLSQAQQWQAVLNVFAQIQAIEPDYPDPEGLLSNAEREVAALKRRAKLEALHSQAVREINAGRWEVARQLLAQVQEMEPGYREAERLLARIEAEASREEAERQRGEQITALYEQAQKLARAGQWKQALAVMEEIQELDPQYPDSEDVAARAREGLEREEEDKQRQNELAALYTEAVRLLQGGQYQEALDKWDEVRVRDPHYPDQQNVQTRARRKLDAPAEVAPRKGGLFKWACAVTAGLSLVALATLVVLPTLVVLLGGITGEGTSKAPPTSTHTPTLPTHTATPLSFVPVEARARLGKGELGGFAFSPNGDYLAVASGVGVYLYRADTFQEVWLGLTEHSEISVAYSPDGTTLASGSRDGTVIVWDAVTGERLRTLKGHTYGANSVAFSPDGTTLASGANDNTVIVWDVETGERLRTLEGHARPVESVAFSPDGTTLASGADDNTVIVWDAVTGERLRTLEGHADAVESVAFSPDGATLASGSRDDTVILWDVKTGERLRTLEGHADAVYSVAFSPDEATLASGSRDDTVILWDVKTGERLRTLEGHASPVESVAFSPDGATLASGSWDGTVILWEVAP